MCCSSSRSLHIIENCHMLLAIVRWNLDRDERQLEYQNKNFI